jgi:glutathione S-transferase
MNSNYTVYYFPGNGRAANIRAILSYAGAKWEDKKVFGEEVQKIKETGNLEYGQFPALEVDGKWLSQTIAIETWLARKFNLLGDNEDDEYEILNLLASREDVGKHFGGLLFPTEEQKAKREEIVKNLTETVLPHILKIVEKKYNAKHGKYFLGDKLTLADIHLSNVIGNFTLLKTCKDAGLDVLPEKYAPNLTKHVENLRNNELASYFKNVYNHESIF